MAQDLTLGDIRSHFFEVAHWVDPSKTCDVIARTIVAPV